MIRQKKLAFALAGVSFIALSASAMPAFAAGTIVSGPGGSSSWSASVDTLPANRDFIIINNNYIVSGDVNLDENVGGGTGTQNDHGFYLDNGALVGGNVNISAYVTANVTTTSPTNDAGTSLAAVLVDDGAQVGGAIINQSNGTVQATARANAHEDATAAAFGIATLLDVNSNVQNHGYVSAQAWATGYDTSLAIAGGVGQVTMYNETTATFSNDGSVNAVSHAKSVNGSQDSSTDTALSLAFGVGQLALGSTVATYITNASAGYINAHAYGTATGTGDQNSLVAGVGVAQAALGEFSATASLLNHGSIYAEGDAFSSSTDLYGEAVALGVGVGALQIAGTLYDEATASITNDGFIGGAARAYASAYDAAANAIGVGSLQVAGSVYGVGTVSLDNLAGGTVVGYGSAVAHGAYATAESYVIGAAQIAIGVGDAAVADISNDGNILAFSSAYSAGEFASANADAAGVKQLSINILDSATASVDNYDEIAAFAFGAANGFVANASAAATGVAQFAAGLGPVSDELTNNGRIYAESWAYSTGFDASAHADAQGVTQYALSLDNVTLSASNNEFITAVAHASAGYSPTEYSEAQADATGIFQGSLTLDLGGLGLTSITSIIGSQPELPVSIAGSADALVNNNGFVGAFAYGSAHAWLGATAYAEAVGVEQSFYNVAGNSTATIDNGGVIVAEARAVAATYDSLLGTYANATATGADQTVASLLGGNAAAILDNTNFILGHAAASAYGSTNVYANAHGAGVSQSAQTFAGGEASTSLINSGTIVGVADAYAEAGFDFDANAQADAVGVAQNADTLATSIATAQLTNNLGQYSSSGIFASAHAFATAYLGDATAGANAVGVYQEASSGINYSATAIITNDGNIVAFAAANATALYDASANAGAFGIGQFASSLSGAASGQIDNNHNVYATAESYAVGEDEVYSTARASAIYQHVESNNDSATATLNNTGNLAAFASAQGWSYDSSAYGYATAIGAQQVVDSVVNGLATGTVDNSANGVIVATATAWVWGTDKAYASANAFGVGQLVGAGLDTALASLTNDGGIAARAYATASNVYDVAETADAYAHASGVYQSASSFHGNSTVELTNGSTGIIRAEAYANAFGSSAYAEADAFGVSQVAYGAGANSLASITANNEHDITAFAYANATTGHTTNGDAEANARAVGLYQYGSSAGESSLAVTNSGYIGASAVAYASASSEADVNVFATGVSQFASSDAGSSDTFDNSGTVQAFAKGYVFASSEAAVVEAVAQYAGGFGDVVLDVTNETGAHITANAFVNSRSGQAFAVGAWEGTDEFSTLSGTINNAGVIHASATALYGASAQAIGVLETGEGSNTTVLTNTGGIFALATAQYGSDAQATGISISGGSELVPFINNPNSAPIVNNDGGVIVAQIDVNGDQSRGNAINTRGSLNNYVYFAEANGPVEINLMGGAAGDLGKAYVMSNDGLVSDDVEETFAGHANYGYIYGNIQLTEDDTVNVSEGATIFDGQFNAGGDLVGTLNIQDGGTLVLVQNHDPLDPESGGYVDSLNMSPSGTLAVELTPSQASGDYPQLHTNSANLDGTLQVVYDAGLYSNEGYYADVITGNVAGTFANVTDNQVLLDTTAIYYDSHVDIGYERVAFNAVEGLTTNQKNVGGAIEKVYPDIDPNTPFGDLVADMFTLDAADYKKELDQLSGSQYANHLQSVLWSTRAIDRVITERMECKDDTSHDKMASNGDATVGNNTIAPTADVISSTGCFHPGEANIWMSGFGQWNKLSGDQNAPGYDETQYGILFGADYSFTDSLFFGVAGGYFNSKGDFDNWGGANGASIDYDGLNIAAYGGYDNSTYYLRGIVAYGNYSGDAHRSLALDAPNTEYSTLKGNPDSDTWSFYGETGYRFNLSSVGQITPFLGLSIATANLDGFTEKDPDNSGAALNVHSSNANSVASVLGARFTADMAMGSGVFSPVLSVAWMHEFDDTRQEVNMSFAGAPSGATFTSVGSNVARDSAVVDAGAKFQFNDALDVGLYYNGQFNTDYTSNGVTATLGYKF